MDRLDAAAAVLASFTTPLSKEDRKRALKKRTGGEAVIDTVGALAGKHHVKLATSVERMQSSVKAATALAPIRNVLAAMLQRVDDSILASNSVAWSAATGYYTILQRMAREDPELETALAGVVAFFAVGKRDPAAPRRSKQPGKSAPRPALGGDGKSDVSPSLP